MGFDPSSCENPAFLALGPAPARDISWALLWAFWALMELLTPFMQGPRMLRGELRGEQKGLKGGHNPGPHGFEQNPVSWVTTHLFFLALATKNNLGGLDALPERAEGVLLLAICPDLGTAPTKSPTCPKEMPWLRGCKPDM